MSGVRTRLWASWAIVLLIASLLPTAASSTAASQPLCADVGPGPVLQDSNWQLLNATTGYHNFATQYASSSVMKQGSGFVVYVGGQLNNTIGIFRGTSPDGRSWNVSGAPVLTTGPAGSWDQSSVFSPDVVWNGTGYMMFYTGDGATNASTYPANFRQIGVAFSSDGVSWTRFAGNPVIIHGPGSYDSRYTRAPSVLFENGVYDMWYWGTADTRSAFPFRSTVDFANSTDGVHWTKYSGSPVFTGFEYPSGTEAAWPSVIRANGTYLMAFSDSASNIGYATSHDGIAWYFNNQTNVLVTLSGWHSTAVFAPSLILDGNSLRLWYFGSGMTNSTSPYVAGIGLATCGLLLAPPQAVVTSSTTRTATFAETSVSTSISTSIVHSTVVSTLVEATSTPIVDVATAGVVGFAAATAVAVALLATRLKRRAPSS